MLLLPQFHARATGTCHDLCHGFGGSRSRLALRRPLLRVRGLEHCFTTSLNSKLEGLMGSNALGISEVDIQYRLGRA